MAQPDIAQLISQARMALQQDNIQQARAIVKQILTLDRQNTDAWLIASYLSDDPNQQRIALDNAKRVAPTDPRIAARERELFRRPVGTFVPDPVQPSAAAASPRPSVTTDHIPTLADGVASPSTQLLGYLPCAVVAGGIVVLVLLGIFVNSLFQQPLSDSPSAIVLRFYPAIQAGDNATLATLLADQVKAVCGNDLVQCMHVPAQQFSEFSIVGETITGQTALVTLRFQRQGAADAQCQKFDVIQTGQGWKILKNLGDITSCSSQALLPSQAAAAANLSSPTADVIQIAMGQTETPLAQTYNAMVVAQTQTQSVVSMTQIGLTTGTPVAQTQIASTGTQTALLYKKTLTGKLVAAQTIQGKAQIVTLNVDGTHLVALNAIGINPIWSPDGQHILYTNRVGTNAIHVMAADGSQDMDRSIPRAPFGSDWGTWSADGHTFLFEGQTRIMNHAAFTSGSDGSNVTQLLDDDHDGGWTTWSPDNKKLLFVKDDQMWVINVGDTTPHSLAKQAGARAAVWSPDGQQIAFDAGNDSDRELYLMNADGSNAHRLTAPGTQASFPSWSPDSKHLVALCFDPQRQGTVICILDADGTNLTYISDAGFQGRISWKP